MKRWYIITCAGGQERKCAHSLAWLGHPGTWYPIRVIKSWLKGKRIKRTRAEVPGYVFLCASSVSIYAVNTYEPFRMRVFCVRGEPYMVSDEEMAKMKQFPDRVRDLAEELRRIEEEERLARIPVIGEAATITGGIFAGKSGPVEDINDNGVKIDLGGRFARVEAKLVERAA